jgi:hypothetical protein
VILIGDRDDRLGETASRRLEAPGAIDADFIPDLVAARRQGGQDVEVEAHGIRVLEGPAPSPRAGR